MPLSVIPFSFIPTVTSRHHKQEVTVFRCADAALQWKYSCRKAIGSGSC